MATPPYFLAVEENPTGGAAAIRGILPLIHFSSPAALVFRFGETLYNPWASSLRSFRPLCPNMLLYWEMLSCACQQGLRFFDFGRSSPRASTCAFKLQWGAETRPLVWHLFSRHAQPWVPERESLVIASWKTLDLSVSRKRGPELRRWISL